MAQGRDEFSSPGGEGLALAASTPRLPRDEDGRRGRRGGAGPRGHRVLANLGEVLPTIRARGWRAVRDAPGPAEGLGPRAEYDLAARGER
jgi:hypothetical protein